MVSRDEMKKLLEWRRNLRICEGVLRFGQRIRASYDSSKEGYAEAYKRNVNGCEQIANDIERIKTQITQLENRLEIEGMEEGIDMDELIREVK